MYSLYRAWLMRDAVAAASLATPPDVLITVGSPATESSEGRGYSYQFVAHKHLVALHSGYLKSLLASEPSAAAIAVPSVTPDTFAPLLSFMYTGYLDLNTENIYSVLLATHLLHMPRALDLCRAFLVQNQPELQRGAPAALFPFPSSPGIVKPIPSRKYSNFPHPLWSPVSVPPLLLHTTPNGPFRSVQADKQDTAEIQRAHTPRSPLPSTSKTEDRPNTPASRQSSGSPCPSNASFTSDERTVHVVKSPTRKTARKRDPYRSPRKVNNENAKGVLDVACCDGPVRFHRVLNESYGLSLDEIMDGDVARGPEEAPASPSGRITDKEYLDNYPKTQYLKLKSDEKFSNFMHQQMLSSNMYKKSKTTKGVIQLRKIIEKEVRGRERDHENEPSDAEESRDEQRHEAGEDGQDSIYTCVYCNHTFKSQYCYQKHARRHINPVDVGKETAGKSMVIVRKVVSATKVSPHDHHHSNIALPLDVPSLLQPDTKDASGKEVRREVRLLDMNVQYYPCKTCGSKFPSYYFVHKHRKMCHSGEEQSEEEPRSEQSNLSTSDTASKAQP